MFEGVFTGFTLLYVLVIGGIILADVLFVSNTQEGRRQFLESIRDREVLHAVWLSLWTSVLSTFISLVVVIPAGYLISKYRGNMWVEVCDVFIDVPIVLPAIVFGISLLVFFEKTFVGGLSERLLGLRFVHQPSGIVLVQTLISSAYGVRVMESAFDGVDHRMADVARTLGAGPWKAFYTVTLPHARDGVITASVLVWARSIAFYGPIIAFVGATTMYTEVMPTRIYLEMSIGRLEAALSIALMMIALSMGALLLIRYLGRSFSRHEVRR